MNHLVIENLSKYYGQICALDHVNLNLKTGIYGLLGQNGAGKSTLMKILTRNIMQSSGLISYNGVDISAKDSTFIHQVGYMPQQQDMIPSFSVASFMYYMASLKSMNKSIIEEEIRGFLKATNTYSFKDRSLASLSGGMKQRVLIAQALLNNPKILLLDEPTAGLDPLERLNFRDIIAQHAQDKIIILATHVISDIELIADRIIFLQNGKVLTVNSQNHLLEQTKVYETMEDINHLKASDSSIKVINRLPSKMGIKTRFISKMVYEHSVSTTLDDVYIDWLGNR